MKLLYLSEDYAGSKVHHELVSRIVESGVSVCVFTIVRIADKDNDIRNTYNKIKYKIISDTIPAIYKKPYKYLFGFKRRFKLSMLVHEINPADFDIVHAATLFSEGVIAYELHKRYGIPYTVAVRATDLDLYLAKMPHLWRLGRKILKSASKIIFISSILQQKFSQKFAVKKIYSNIKDKCTVIPNGIEDYWINNYTDKRVVSKPSQILYVGRFDKNKNVEALIQAVLQLRERIPDIKLNLVGGGDICHNDVINYCNMFPQHLRYLGKVYDKDKLADIFRNNHVFAMVSHSETFGLVYLEASSQGLPILYTAGQGIDGSIDTCFGEKADSHSVADIREKLLKLCSDYTSYQSLGERTKDFSWSNIATRYLDIYNQVIQ